MSTKDPLKAFDASHFQEGLSMRKAWQSEYRLGIFKATEGPYRDGSKYTDPAFESFMARTHGEGLERAAYCFLVKTDPEKQAEHFLRVVGDPAGKGLVVDFETYPGRFADVLTPTNSHLEGFIKALRRHVGNHPIGIYTNRSFWSGGDPSGLFNQYGADWAWDSRYPDLGVHEKPWELYDSLVKGTSFLWGSPWGGIDDELLAVQFTSTGLLQGRYMDIDAVRSEDALRKITGRSH